MEGCGGLETIEDCLWDVGEGFLEGGTVLGSIVARGGVTAGELRVVGENVFVPLERLVIVVFLLAVDLKW